MSAELLPAYCYVATTGGLSKIGLSFDPEHRMTLLHAKLRFKLRFAPYKVAYNAESFVKGFFAPALAFGEEWFTADPDHMADVLIASGERAFMAYCCDIIVRAINHGMFLDVVAKLGIDEYLDVREYPLAWWQAREELKQARRNIRLAKRGIAEAKAHNLSPAEIFAGGAYPEDWAAKFAQHRANKKRDKRRK